jgi:hypothetical protein
MFETLPTIEKSGPGVGFVERAKELRQLLENPPPGNFLTAERIRTRQHALRLQLQAEFIHEFGLSLDERGRTRRDYYRRFSLNPPSVFDHLEFFRLGDWRIVISQPYCHVEDGLIEELASLACQNSGQFSVFPEWSYWYPGHTILILFLFPPLPLKRDSGPMCHPHHLSPVASHSTHSTAAPPLPNQRLNL